MPSISVKTPNIENLSYHLTQNTVRLYYKNQSASTVRANNRCLLYESRKVFLCFFSVVRQMPGYTSQRQGTVRTLPN